MTSRDSLRRRRGRLGLVLAACLVASCAPALAWAQGDAAGNDQAAAANASSDGNDTADASTPKHTPPPPPPPAADNQIVPKASFNSLMELFVLAAVLESALALLFNWRPFIMTFDGRGVKPVVSLAAAWILVAVFRIDILADLATAYGQATAHNPFSELITAMVIAGGSSGVNRLLRALGVREVVQPQDITPRPPPTRAWISVRYAARAKAIGPVLVQIKDDGQVFRVAGAIAGPSRMAQGSQVFLRDPGRLPGSGGLEVAPDADVEVKLTGVDRAGNAVATPPWGPLQLRAGAIVDLDFEL